MLEDELKLTVLLDIFNELDELESIELDDLDELELNLSHERDRVFGNGNNVPSQSTEPESPLLFCSSRFIVPAPGLCPTAVRFINNGSL